MAHKHRTVADMAPKTPEAELGDRMLQRTTEIISHFLNLNPNLIFYMENPQGRMRHSELLAGLPPHRRVTVSYCKYGFNYQKHTDIWTNDMKWDPRAKCSKTLLCVNMVDGRHPRGVRRIGSLQERYRIPPELVQEIVLSGHGQVLANRSPRVADVEQ
jgi:hypothetical protein